LARIRIANPTTNAEIHNMATNLVY